MIFNALIIVALIPLALRGVAYRAGRRGRAAAPQPADLRPRRHHRAVHRHQAHRSHRRGARARLKEANSCLHHLRPALVLLALFVALTGIAYPLAMTGIAQVALPRPGERQPDRTQRRRRRLGHRSASRSRRSATSSRGRRRPARPTRRIPPRPSMRPTTPPARAARISARPRRSSSIG